MKILHVTKKYPDALGGDAVVVSALQQQQLRAGHQVAILTSNCQTIRSGPHIYKVGLRDSPANLDQITPRRLLSLLSLVFRTFFVLAKERPDVVHAHSIDMSFAVSLAARLWRVPLVHTFHIVTFHDASQSALRRKLELRLARWARPRALTAPNQHDVAALQKAGLARTLLLPNGVDVDFWRPPATRSQKAKQEPFIFVSAGRLEQQKGYDFLIRAAALLKKTTHRKFRIVIAGEGGQAAQLERLIRRCAVSDVVTLVGRKSPAELYALLAAADAAVFPSLYETTPLTLLEAWAVGLPVIMTPVGLLREAKPQTQKVLLVPAKNVPALTQVMAQCMRDDNRRQAVAAAGHEAVQAYAWPHIARSAEMLYRSIL